MFDGHIIVYCGKGAEKQARGEEKRPRIMFGLIMFGLGHPLPNGGSGRARRCSALVRGIRGSMGGSFFLEYQVVAD